MRVLVIGGTGFLGRAVCRRLDKAGIDHVALARRPHADIPVVIGDVQRPGLGVGNRLAELQATITKVVFTFGSVDWDQRLFDALALHDTGTEHALAFVRELPKVDKVVAISSLLALGDAGGVIGNRELELGQRFRNPYEYAKFLAERRLRKATDLPITTLRFGPLLGLSDGSPPDPSHGLIAALPPLLAGYPVHLSKRGVFPSYVGDVEQAAALVDWYLHDGDLGTRTWFDPDRPTVLDVLSELCRPWRVVPRIVDVAALGKWQRPMARRLGFPATLLDYTSSWFELDSNILDELPAEILGSPSGYLAATARALADVL